MTRLCASPDVVDVESVWALHRGKTGKKQGPRLGPTIASATHDNNVILRSRLPVEELSTDTTFWVRYGIRRSDVDALMQQHVS